MRQENVWSECLKLECERRVHRHSRLQVTREYLQSSLVVKSIFNWFYQYRRLTLVFPYRSFSLIAFKDDVRTDSRNVRRIFQTTKNNNQIVKCKSMLINRRSFLTNIHVEQRWEMKWHIFVNLCIYCSVGKTVTDDQVYMHSRDLPQITFYRVFSISPSINTDLS